MTDSDRNSKRKRRRQGGTLDIVNGLLSLLMLAMLALVAIVIYGVHLLEEPGPSAAQTAFLVEPKSSLGTVADRLEEQGLIANRTVFLLGGKLMKKDSRLKPGQFLIPAGASMSNILTLLTEGKPVEFYIDVIPGETTFSVAARLNDPAQNLTGDPVPVPPEGTLWAARQDFFPGDTRKSVIDAMQKRFQDELKKIWAGRDPAIEDVIKSPDDLVKLASIVERETGLDAERPQVAAVFLNRLRKGMRLQSDPTTIYGASKGVGKLDHSLTKAELEAENPFNTYQIKGLPPTPIANPGLKSLLAVAHPSGGNDLYFVAKSADPADGHLFAATYAAHKKNVALYRQAVHEQAQADAEVAKDALEAGEAAAAGDTSQ